MANTPDPQSVAQTIELLRGGIENYDHRDQLVDDAADFLEALQSEEKRLVAEYIMLQNSYKLQTEEEDRIYAKLLVAEADLKSEREHSNAELSLMRIALRSTDTELAAAQKRISELEREKRQPDCPHGATPQEHEDGACPCFPGIVI